MGMTQAKSLLEVKPGLRFLDVIARQILALRAKSGAAVPLVLMDSFRTREDSLEALDAYPALALPGLPLDFLQHKVPRLRVEDMQPIAWPAEPSHEWCPPGHGDLYVALVTSGMLAALRERGIRFVFVSNADNLGADLDPALLGAFVASGAPFAMEVCERSEADRKGGHLARRADGQLVLRESAQCPEADVPAFQDVSRHRFFNTNNLWLDLDALAATLEARGGLLELPMICNEKPVDPTDPGSPRVVQLETAMGAAISVFEGAQALRVPRTRFAPVKTTSDLLAVRSDAFAIDEAFRVVTAPAREGRSLFVDLDPVHYRTVEQLEAHFPFGPPSLVRCRRLGVKDDVRFGRDVVIAGEATLVGPRQIPDGARLGTAAVGG